MNFQNINAASSPEVQINENFETIEYSSVYGKRQPVTTGLTWGYYGGTWGGFTVVAGTLALTDDDDNYISVEVATGAISTEVATTNWNDAGNYVRVYKVTTVAGLVTAAEDHRAGPSGVMGGASGGGGVDAMVFKGSTNCSANPNYPAADAGDTYRVSVAGKIGGASGISVEAADLFICLADATASGNQATVGTSWTVVQANLDGAVIGPASAVSAHLAVFSGTTGKLIADGGVAPSGTNTGDQTITLTGNVTGSGTSSFAATIAAGAVTLAKMASLATARFLGRTTAGSGDPEALTGTQATAMLDAVVGDSGAGGTKGMVPAPGSGDTAAGKFLKADGTFAVPPGTGSGTVTSVAMTVPAHLSISGSPVTTSGTLAVTLSGTALPVANGGTGDTSLTAYAPVFGGTTSTAAMQSGTVGASGEVLTSNGAGVLPTFQTASGGTPRLDQITTGTADSTLSTSGTITMNSGAGSAAPGKAVTIQPGAGGATNNAGGPLTMQGGTGAGSSAGGLVTVQGGTAGATGAGGAVTIASGAGLTAAGGGAISITVGASVQSPGALTLTGSAASGAGATGGAVNLVAGASSNGTSSAGGPIAITGGAASAGAGGAVTITSGVGGGAGAGGASTLKGGAGGATSGATGGAAATLGGTGTGSGNGGAATVTGGTAGSTGTGGAATITGGTPIAGAGGVVNLTGAAGVGTNKNGGSVNLTPGAATGTGQPGYVNLNGSGSALATTAIGGFALMATCAGTPSGTPGAIPTGTVPFVFDSTNSKFYVYVGGAWKSVTLA